MARRTKAQDPALLRHLLRARDRIDAASHEEWPTEVAAPEHGRRGIAVSLPALPPIQSERIPLSMLIRIKRAGARGALIDLHPNKNKEVSMQGFASRGLVAACAAAVILALGGCAATRSTFDLPASKAAPAPEAQAPVYVKLVDVTDKRVFEAKPSNPSTPSLGKPEELKDPAITARAVARKRGGFGNAMADILLPPDRTVAQVVREAVTEALSQRGYTVVQVGAPQYGDAAALDVDISQFWTWLTPGFWTLSLENVSVLVLRSPRIFSGREQYVRGYAIVNTMAATDEEWKRTMQLGVKDLVDKVKATLPQANAGGG